MQYDVSTPKEYLDALADDWRKEKLIQLRALLLASADDIIEGINYKILSYADDRGIICHLNAQKGYVALYVGNAAKIDRDGSLLAGINRGKGCIRFKKSNDAGSDNIKRFVALIFQLRRDGQDIDC